MQPEFSPRLPRLTVVVLIVVVISHLVLFCVLSQDAGPADGLEEPEQSGVLRVLTRNTSTTFFDCGDEPSGPEQDLVKVRASSIPMVNNKN